MKPEYQDWIDANVRECYGKCAEVTRAMQAAFPELIRVRGHYGEHAHWWLTTARGEIIDPTRSQFPFLGEYEPWLEGSTEPTGICPNCGDYAYNNYTCCSDTCSTAFTASRLKW